MKTERWKSLLNALEEELMLYTSLTDALSSIDKDILNNKRTLQQTFDLIADKVKTVLGAENVQILRNAGDELVIVTSTSSQQVGEIVPLESVSGSCLRRKTSIRINDLRKYKGAYKKFSSDAGEQMQSELVVPIFTPDSTPDSTPDNEIPFGVINIESKKLKAYTHRHERILSSIAQQASIAIGHSILLDESSFSSDMQSLLKGGVDFQEIQEILEKYAQYAKSSIHASFKEFQLVFVDGPYLEIIYTDDRENFGLKVSIDDSVTGDAARQKKTINHPDLSVVGNYKKLVKGVVCSEIAVPVIIRDQVVAIINVESEKRDAFTVLDAYVLEKFAEQTAELLALTRLQWMQYKTMEKSISEATVLAISDRVGNYAHRLYSLATSIKLCAKGVDKEIEKLVVGALDAEGSIDLCRTYASNIISAADKALAIPAELNKNIELECIDPNVIIRDCIGAAIDGKNNIEVVCRLDECVPKMNLYSFDFVMETLLKNAMDAINEKRSEESRKGGSGFRPLIEVETRMSDLAGQSNKYFIVSVRDNGVGIHPANARSIFLRRFTTKENKTGSGLGYGLWWVKSFVTRTRGYIMVDPNPGTGAKFEIRIPLRDRSA